MKYYKISCLIMAVLSAIIFFTSLFYALSGENLFKTPLTAVLLVVFGVLTLVCVCISTVGGGVISLDYMNGYMVGISCNLPTLIVPHRDLPGTIAAISKELAADNLNIAYMKLSRAKRGGSVVVVFEIDSPVPEDTRERIRKITGIDDIIYIASLRDSE